MKFIDNAGNIKDSILSMVMSDIKLILHRDSSVPLADINDDDDDGWDDEISDEFDTEDDDEEEEKKPWSCKCGNLKKDHMDEVTRCEICGTPIIYVFDE